jgi:hypothetical protein
MTNRPALMFLPGLFLRPSVTRLTRGQVVLGPTGVDSYGGHPPPSNGEPDLTARDRRLAREGLLLGLRRTLGPVRYRVAVLTLGRRLTQQRAARRLGVTQQAVSAHLAVILSLYPALAPLVPGRGRRTRTRELAPC